MNTDRSRKVMVGFDEVNFSRAFRLMRRVLDAGDEALDLIPEWNEREREKLQSRLEALRKFTEENFVTWHMEEVKRG